METVFKHTPVPSAVGMRIIHILLLAVLHALLIPLCEAGRKGAHFKIMQKQKVLAGAADTIAA